MSTMSSTILTTSALLAAIATLGAAVPHGGSGGYAGHGTWGGNPPHAWLSTSVTTAWTQPSPTGWVPSTTVVVSTPTGTYSGSLSTGTATTNGNASAGALTPGGKKAGSAGGAAASLWGSSIGWYYDWSPAPAAIGSLATPAMLWGDGDNGQVDSQRYQQFTQLSSTPKYVLGFNEPDCSGVNSASMDVDKAVEVWNAEIAPMGEKGALLGSPSMCMQAGETWLEQFNGKALSRSWDFTAVHIYKIDMAGVQSDLDHYWNTYKKPIWVTEFACVNDQNGFVGCSDQGQVNTWINDVVDLFENNEHVMAYGYTDDGGSGGLGPVWSPAPNGQLSESGQTYLSAISKYA